MDEISIKLIARCIIHSKRNIMKIYIFGIFILFVNILAVSQSRDYFGFKV